MSTFGGKIQEIPGISVDRFDKDNFQSEVYFLSHCHTDHMVGLNSYTFHNILLQYNKFIYTSDISCAILKNMYPVIRNNINVLDIYKPSIVVLKDKSVSVTTLPAGHCPGSVMFLFETDVCILYTGDYRIKKSDIRKFRSFYNSFNEVKTFDKIYLDTTFFLESYLKFPSREDSLNELYKIVKEWIDRGKNYLIKLVTSAKYGYEYVFNEIYKRTSMPVHVSMEAYELYSKIPEMDNSVTLNGNITQIHSNCGSTYQSLCPFGLFCEIRAIKISAFRWRQDNLEDGLSSFTSDTFYVCYSTHASYEEGIELIKFLKPKAIEPCVAHNDPYVNVEMARLIKKCLQEFDLKQSIDNKPKLFDTSATEKLPDSLESNCSSFTDEFGVLNSPPRNSTRRKFLKELITEAETVEVSDNLKNNRVVSGNKYSVLELYEVKQSTEIELKLDEKEKLETKLDTLGNDVLHSAEGDNVSKKPLNASSKSLSNFVNTEVCSTETAKANETSVYKDIFWFFESPPQESGSMVKDAKELENLKQTELGESLDKEQSVKEHTTSTERAKEFEVAEGTRKKPKLLERKTNIVRNKWKNIDIDLSVLDDIRWILDSPQEGQQGTIDTLKDFEDKGVTVCEIRPNETEKSENSDDFIDNFLNFNLPPSKHVKKGNTCEKEEVVEESEDVILDIINSS